MKLFAYLFGVALVCTAVASCSNADMAQLRAMGYPGHITCYSGGKVIYDGESTGVIHTEHGSDGWYFAEKGTDHLVRVSGQCVIRANS